MPVFRSQKMGEDGLQKIFSVIELRPFFFLILGREF